MESSIKQLEENLAGHKSFLDKIRRIAQEEEKKRFRSGLVTSALENNVSVGQIGDTLIEILQKCLFDDDNEKKTLHSKLERVRRSFIFVFIMAHTWLIHKLLVIIIAGR